MTRTRTALAALSLAFALGGATSGQAQQSDSASTLECRGFNGIYVDVWWDRAPGDTASGGGKGGGFRFDGRRTIDTTLTFNVAERTWTRPMVTAVVVAGVSSDGASRTSAGTTTAASADSRREWHVCTGATLSGRQPTIVLRGVRGQLRLKVDLTALANIRGARLSDSTRTDRR